MTKIVVVGDTLLDRDITGSVERIGADAPVPVVDESNVSDRAGGAGLAATLLAMRGIETTLVTAFAPDEGGAVLRGLLATFGIDVIDIGLDGVTKEKVRVRADGQTVLRLDRGEFPALRSLASSGTPVSSAEDTDLVTALEHALDDCDAVLVSDYAGGVASLPALRSMLSVCARPIVWDPHRNGATPIEQSTVVTPNIREARAASSIGSPDASFGRLTEMANHLVREWSCDGVALTMGERGVMYCNGGTSPVVVPPPLTGSGDVCGAGDCFASTLASELGQGRLIGEALQSAVGAAAIYVAGGGAAELGAPRQRTEQSNDVEQLLNGVRARGGRVVVAGGCFDLLHAGHVSLLRAARSLGDCLVVCLNSDRSVRALKGPTRPVVNEDDRAAVLLGLRAVDGVVVFDEDTPVEALRSIRPDVFAKGGDYMPDTIPEAEVLAEWGGQTVILPYLDGRSTTTLVREMTSREE